MTTQDDEFAKKLTTYLDRGASDLKAGTAYRLQQIRADVMARLADPSRVTHLRTATASASGGSRTFGGDRPFYAQLRFWLGILMIAAGAYGYQQWQAYQQVKEFEEPDAQILSSDLPIDAYLDRGFQNWIKTGFGE